MYYVGQPAICDSQNFVVMQKSMDKHVMLKFIISLLNFLI